MSGAIDPRALLSFRAVAEHGSFAAAARALGWTQPALSGHVKRLENSLGTPLVVRTVKGVQLTEAGRRLLHHAEIIDDQLTRAASEMAELVGETSPIVRIVSFPSACTSIVAPAMSEVIAKEKIRNRLTVELEQQEPFAVPEMLRRGSADVALIFRYPEEAQLAADDEFEMIPLGWDPLQLIVSQRRGTGGESSSRHLSDHAGDRWVAGCVSCRQHFIRIAQREGFDPDIRHATDDYMVVQELVARDMSVSVVPRLSLFSFLHPGIRAYGLEEGDGRHLMILLPRGESRPEVCEVVSALRRSASRVLDVEGEQPQ